MSIAICSRSLLRYSALLAAFALFACSSATVHAAGTTNVLTLGEALHLADANNLALKAARQETPIARGQVMQARSAALPHLVLSAQYARLDDVATMGDAILGQKDNYEVAADLSQVLYAGGGVRAALRLAKEYDASVEAQIDSVSDYTAYQVHAQFNGILLARQTVEVAEQAVALAEKNLSDVQALLKQGMARRFDLLRAEEQISRSESDRVSAANSLTKAQLGLQRFLELPLDQPCLIDGSLQFDPAPALFSNAVARALQHRPDLTAVERSVAVQREALAVARSGKRPTVAAFGQLKHANPDRSFQDEWENSWMIGVRAEFPVFDGMQTRGKVAQERARLQQAELRRDDLASQIRLEVTQARVDMESATRLVEARRKNVSEAEEALRLVQRSYAEGLAQQIDVISAQLSFTNSRQGQAIALYQYVMACRRMQLAMGTLTRDDKDPKQNDDIPQVDAKENN